MINTLFMGRKQVAANCLEWLISNPQFNVLGVLTDNHLCTSPTTRVAEKHRLPLLNYDSATELANTGRIDLGLSVLYWRKLKGPLLLSNSQYGCINFHPAILPEYKGCAGYNLAILNCLSSWGSSCHYIDESIDTGGIIDVTTFPIDDSLETAFSLEKKTLRVMEVQFKNVLSRYSVDIAARFSALPNIGGNYTSRQEMELMKQIFPGDNPERKARAFYFPPYDGAWCEVNGERVNVIPTSVLRSLGDPSSSSLFTESQINA